MKILHTVESYAPCKCGVAEAVRQISEHLVKMGHEVTVATTKINTRNYTELNGVKIVEFEIFASGGTEEYIKFLKNSEFDIIMNYAAQQWATDLMLPIVDEIKGKKILLPCGFSSIHNKKSKTYYENMASWMKKYDACIFLSKNYQDYEFAQKNNITNTIIIPNGADENEFLNPVHGIRKKFDIPEEDLLIIHVGSHTLLKGHREALQLYHRTKLPESTFILIGNHSSRRCYFECKFREKVQNFYYQFRKINKRVIIADLTRTETVMAYHDADLFLFPSNIECSPIVLFEAMASKTPFLVTDVGNSKEIVSNSNAGILLPTKKIIHKISRAQFQLSKVQIKKAVPLFNEIAYSKEKRETLGENGRKFWEESYTWSAIAKKYETLYNHLLER